ncbi:MAG: hypothetical protein Q4D38_02950 [Planctomycetia bacterium]|nr:hypothetical protein [Planctomycetia bacterium]
MYEKIVEDSFLLLALGGLTTAFCIAGYVIQPHKGWIFGGGVALLLTIATALADYYVVTDREMVQIVINEAVDSVRANDPDRFMKILSPEMANRTRGRVEWACRNFHFESVKISNCKIETNEYTSPPTAEAEFLCGFSFRDKSGHFAGFERYACRIKASLEKRRGTWLVSGHQEHTPLGQEY